MATYEKHSFMGLWWVTRRGRQEGPAGVSEDEVIDYIREAAEDDYIRMQADANGIAYGRIGGPGFD